MTMHATLKAEKRAGTGKGAARKLRASGLVPAVLYGRGDEAIAISVDAHEARLLFQSISIENTLVDLTLDGKPIQTLVREVQVHASRPDLIHVDFYRVQKGVLLDVEIPVHLVGTPVGVKMHGGVVQQIVHELPVRTLPTLIPDSFEVDVSALDVGDSIHVSDLALPEGVEVQLEPDQTVCSVVVPRGLVSEEAEEAEAALAEGEEAGDGAEEGEGEPEE
jgi:large subunit ribosomal protein L25